MCPYLWNVDGNYIYVCRYTDMSLFFIDYGEDAVKVWYRFLCIVSVNYSYSSNSWEGEISLTWSNQ